MGMYASARGWLEIAFQQRHLAQEIIQRHDDGHYTGGWAFPTAPFNWTLYFFYGGDIREGDLPWLRAQIAEMAGLSSVDDDDDRPKGMFVITDERGQTAIWQVRNGSVDELALPSLAWLGD